MNFLSLVTMASLSLSAFAFFEKEDRLFNVGIEPAMNRISEGIPRISEPGYCAANFQEAYHVLYNFKSTDIDLQNMSSDKINKIINKSFQLRLAIKTEMGRFKSEIDPDCLTGIKNIVKALRYVEDYMIEFDYRKNGRMNEEYTTLEGEGAHFLKNAQFDFTSHKDLASGDVLISRGNAYTSAAIARIGEDDYQFSHMTLLYLDENNEMHTTEAHIEIGSVVAPFQIHLDQKNARTVVFKAKDKKLSEKAGAYSYNYVKEHKANRGFNIPYDFAMDYSNPDLIFCSEVIFLGYLEASRELYGKNLELPLFKTRFRRGQIPFLQRVGINVDESNIDTFRTFGPGDIQFDPNFDIVAEWRNPKKLQDSRFKDAILTKMFEWMEKENYSLRVGFFDKLKNAFGWIMRRSSWASRLLGLDEKFPLNMTLGQMNLFIGLDKAAEKIYAKLEAEQAQSETPLSFKELYEIIEAYKVADRAVYDRYLADRRYNRRARQRGLHNRRRLIKPEFHLSFRP